MAKSDLTVARLRELLYYNARTGLFTWAKKSGIGSHACAGFSAGSVIKEMDCASYVRIGIDGYQHLAHRLAWLYATDIWPKGEIDHINGDKLDNRWSNLRDVPKIGNRQNIRLPQSNNTSGYLGVSLSKGRWTANISVGGQKIWLGRFSTPKLAFEAYIAAKREMHSTCTI